MGRERFGTEDRQAIVLRIVTEGEIRKGHASDADRHRHGVNHSK
jgi:ribosome maturation protein Sdo1